MWDHILFENADSFHFGCWIQIYLNSNMFVWVWKKKSCKKIKMLSLFSPLPLVAHPVFSSFGPASPPTPSVSSLSLTDRRAPLVSLIFFLQPRHRTSRSAAPAPPLLPCSLGFRGNAASSRIFKRHHKPPITSSCPLPLTTTITSIFNRH